MGRMEFLSPELALQAAIETGDTVRVRQLVESGINPDTVLHSVTRRESTTVLGMAAFEGQLAIMEYLLQVGASAKLKDPYFGRNPLHWACAGGASPAVRLLLRQKIDVNAVDRDNVSPLIRAAMMGNVDIVEMLIRRGADVRQLDRLRSSALHYSTFNATPEVTSALIRAGCIHNNPSIFGQGTPLANLVFRGDVANCLLLIEAGYRLENEAWLQTCADKMLNDTKISSCVRMVLYTQYNVMPLVNICCAAIRRAMRGPNLTRRLALLPLPDSLINFVSLN